MFFFQRFDKVIYIPILLKRGRRYTNSQNGKKDKKENYRPVSILPVLSKIFEKIIFIQMSAFLKTFLTNNNADSVKVIAPCNVC